MSISHFLSSALKFENNQFILIIELAPHFFKRWLSFQQCCFLFQTTVKCNSLYTFTFHQHFISLKMSSHAAGRGCMLMSFFSVKDCLLQLNISLAFASDEKLPLRRGNHTKLTHSSVASRDQTASDVERGRRHQSGGQKNCDGFAKRCAPLRVSMTLTRIPKSLRRRRTSS